MQIRTLREAISQPSILYPAIFCFIWQATPSADTALFYFYNDALGFGPEFLGRIRLVGSVSALAGVWVFNTFLKKVQLRSIFRWTAITGTVLSFTQVQCSPAMLCIVFCCCFTEPFSGRVSSIRGRTAPTRPVSVHVDGCFFRTACLHYRSYTATVSARIR